VLRETNTGLPGCMLDSKRFMMGRATMVDSIRIGGASGFWGDTASAVPQLLKVPDLDFLVFDYLAELTLAIMAGQRARSPQAGYATDFVQVTLREHLPELLGRGIRVVSNAGGIHPQACAKALADLARDLGLRIRIGLVLGDDLLHREEEFRASQRIDMSSGAAFPDKVLSINAYLGARPIAQALDAGAQVVITGRCVDSAVTLGAMMHAFGWHKTVGREPSQKLLDRLAQGTLAGHLIECGAQCTGGLFTDWQQVTDWENIGFPVVEAWADGRFEIFKPEGTGGMITPATVAEQLLYEIADPAAYVVPDVVCDWTGVVIRPSGLDRVSVEGARGLPPPRDLKLSLTWQDGWKNQVLLVIGGEHAAAKARRTADALLARLARMLQGRGLAPLAETHVEVLGSEAMYGPSARAGQAREVVLRIAARCSEKASLELFGREFAAAATSMAPGTSGFGKGRAAPSALIRLFSLLEPRQAVSVRVLLDEEELVPEHADAPDASDLRMSSTAMLTGNHDGRVVAGLDARTLTKAARAWSDPRWARVRLIELAHGRSGDKGNTANIGLIARHPANWPWLLAVVDEALLRRVFAHRQILRLRRYALPGIHGLNLVLEGVLGGGGMASLHTDNLAKAYAQILLGAEVPRPPPRTLGVGHSDGAVIEM